MREALGHEHLLAIAGGQLDRDVPAEGRGGAPEIDRDVENATAQGLHQLGLRKGRQLVVQPAHRAHRARKRLVILNEGPVAEDQTPIRILVGFHEETPAVAVNLQLHELHAGQGEIGDLHGWSIPRALPE